MLDTLKRCREAERKRLQGEFDSVGDMLDEGQAVDRAAALGINVVKKTVARQGDAAAGGASVIIYVGAR